MLPEGDYVPYGRTEDEDENGVWKFLLLATMVIAVLFVGAGLLLETKILPLQIGGGLLGIAGFVVALVCFRLSELSD